MLTIVIPVKNPKFLSEFVSLNESYLEAYDVVVIDSGGGEQLKKFSSVYLLNDVPFWTARRIAYSYVKTPFILNLDSDVIIPSRYPEEALDRLRINGKIGAISIFFENIEEHRGILEYGISLWRTQLLKEQYDYQPKPSVSYECECFYMWKKLHQAGFKLETLLYRAKHLG